MEANHEPALWRFDRDGSNPKRKSPANIFHETDLYTRERTDGTRDLEYEHALGEMESAYCPVRDTKIIPCEALSKDDIAVLMLFMALQYNRTPLMRDHLGSQFDQVIVKAERIERVMNAMTPEQRAARRAPPMIPGNRDRSISLDQMRALRDRPLLTAGPAIAKGMFEVMQAMFHITVLCTDDPVGFITSDAPCVVFDHEWQKKRPIDQTHALMWPTTEVTLPVAPGRMIVAARTPWRGQYAQIKPEGMRLIDAYNQRTRWGCKQHFASINKELRAAWFDAGKPK